MSGRGKQKAIHLFARRHVDVVPDSLCIFLPDGLLFEPPIGKQIIPHILLDPALITISPVVPPDIQKFIELLAAGAMSDKMITVHVFSPSSMHTLMYGPVIVTSSVS
jgi:hypothetical protein